MRIALFALLMTVLALFPTAAATPSDWSRAATHDLVAMHYIIEVNHPGPVDPLNPSFKNWLRNLCVA
jgi:hypothetical protein